MLQPVVLRTPSECMLTVPVQAAVQGAACHVACVSASSICWIHRCAGMRCYVIALHMLKAQARSKGECHQDCSVGCHAARGDMRQRSISVFKLLYFEDAPEPNRLRAVPQHANR